MWSSSVGQRKFPGMMLELVHTYLFACQLELYSGFSRPP